MMQFFSFPFLTPTYVTLKKKTVSLKLINSPGGIFEGFGLGGAGGGGDGFSLGGGRGDGGGGMIGRPLCMVLSGQSRLAEVHF
jgi:hypothetical protein